MTIKDTNKTDVKELSVWFHLERNESIEIQRNIICVQTNKGYYSKELFEWFLPKVVE